MTETKSQTNPLGTKQVEKLPIRFAISGIISMVINSLYNMMDQIFIGQGVGILGNGATNIIAPISTIAIALSSLFGDGLATYFSLQLGKGEPEKASKAMGNAVIAGTGVSILLTAAVLFLLNPLCRLLVMLHCYIKFSFSRYFYYTTLYILDWGFLILSCIFLF